MTDQAFQGSDDAALQLKVDLAETKADLDFAEPEVDDAVRERAREYAAKLLDFTPGDEEGRQAATAAVELMGRDLQRRSAERSQLLQAPIHELAKATEDGGPVANSLVELRIQVEELDPAKVDLSPGWFTRLVGAIPGIGTPLKRYFMRYESTQTVIDSIIQSLERGREQLKRDNITLAEDQRTMRELTHDLARTVTLAQALDERIVYMLEREISQDDPRRQWVEEDLLFALRQRAIDIQQQLAVNQQGVLATELIIRNNRELIRGVNRAIDVTVSALQVAVTVALALAHQKIVLDKIEALNTTTSELIRGTAQRLREQGQDIQRRASTATLDMDALRSAFADINTAMDEISRYRREALPQMATTILELDQLTEAGEEAVQRMEQSRRVDPLLELELD
jgi:uncharacterized protein YaaN involved in tellurite resistance